MIKTKDARNFISMMRPILGITQKGITGITINANVNDAVRIEVRCIGREGADMQVVECTDGTEKPEAKRYIVTVKEVAGD